MIVLGLTGSVGMGKSTVARMLKTARIPVFDADAYVHRALRRGGRGVRDVAHAFPAAYDGSRDAIDRTKLGALVFNNPPARKKLEAILHPLVRNAELRFIRRHQAWRTRLIVLDIPLMFETRADVLCHAVICVTAPKFIQQARVMARPGMTADKFARILAAQMPDAEKRLRADYILQTGHGRHQTWRDLQTILTALKTKHA